MDSCCRKYRFILCIFFMVASCSVSASQNAKVGFISLFKENVNIKEFGYDAIFSNSSIRLELGTEINANNYIKLRNAMKPKGCDVIDIELTGKSHAKILSDYDGLTKEGKALLDEYADKYGVSKIVLLMQAYITEKFTFTVGTKYGDITHEIHKNIKGHGFYFIEGSHLNWKMGNKKPLFSYMTARLFLYDVVSGKVKSKKDFKYIKNIVLEKIYDNEMRNKIFEFVTRDVFLDDKKNKFKELVYSEKFDKKKLRDFYSKENGSMDDFFDMVHELDELTFDKYERLANFKYLTKSVVHNMKRYLEDAQNNIIKLASDELQNLIKNP